MLLATRHRRTHSALTPASKVGTWFTNPTGMEGWVDLGGWLHPGRESNPRLLGWKYNALTTAQPRRPPSVAISVINHTIPVLLVCNTGRLPVGRRWIVPAQEPRIFDKHSLCTFCVQSEDKTDTISKWNTEVKIHKNEANAYVASKASYSEAKLKLRPKWP